MGKLERYGYTILWIYFLWNIVKIIGACVYTYMYGEHGFAIPDCLEWKHFQFFDEIRSSYRLRILLTHYIYQSFGNIMYWIGFFFFLSFSLALCRYFRNSSFFILFRSVDISFMVRYNWVIGHQHGCRFFSSHSQFR